MSIFTHDASGVQKKIFKYTRSHHPGFMYIFALCFLNEPLKYSHAVFLSSFIVESSSLLDTYRLFMEPTPFLLFLLRSHLQKSFPVLGSFTGRDHLRAVRAYRK